MNWKNISLEQGFVKQEIHFNGEKAVNYIPIDQIDSFGVVSSENKRWLYAGVFFGMCSVVSLISQNVQATLYLGIISAGLIGFYFLSRKTWLAVTSSQTKFSVEVSTSKEELLAVDTFLTQMKEKIQSTSNFNSKAA